jgi:hypothetical protein
LVEHLGKTAKSLGFQNDAFVKSYQAAYFLKIKGYLSAADLLREIAANKQDQSTIGSSELLKKELFNAGVFDGTVEMDSDARAQIVDAIKTIGTKKWAERAFYEIEEHIEGKKEEPQVNATEETQSTTSDA